MKKIIAFILLITLSSTIAYYYLFHKENHTDKITNNNKNFGSYNIVQKDNYIFANFISDDYKINEIVNKKTNEIITNIYSDKNNKYILDYSSDIFYDNIIQITYKLTKNKNIEHETNILIDKNNKKELLFKDIFRDNPFLFSKYFPNIKMETINKNKIYFEKNFIKIGEKDNNINIDINNMKNLFKNGTGIPNLYNKPILNKKEFSYDLNKKLIAFTFDDGPLNEYHIKIRELFNKYNIPATFYVIGNLANSKSDVIKQTYIDGHTIANHTYTHPGLISHNLTTLSKEKIREEIELTDDAIFRAIGVDAKTARPPGGFTNQYVEQSTHLPMIKWDVDSKDWQYKNKPEIVYTNVRYNIKNNSIVLFHDLYPSSYEAVKKLIPELINEGYQFVDIDTLLQHKNQKNKI